MRAADELVGRLARRRAESLGGLSDGGFRELEIAVREDPQGFVDDPADEAFMLVTRALERNDAAAAGEDLLDDDEFYVARGKRLARLGADCAEALAIDPRCTDAALLATLARDLDPDRLLTELLALEESAPQVESADNGSDVWDDLASRPTMRLRAAIARTALDTARYRMAAKTCERAFELSPADALGFRHTAALAYARLEDEGAFEALDVRFSRRGSAWNHLARTILLYKLGRMGAARRAIEGFSRLCEGGAYALLRPVLVDIYLPDRPALRPLCFEEATLAVHESDPIVVDVPDFVSWAQDQRTVFFAAEDFAQRRDLDW